MKMFIITVYWLHLRITPQKKKRSGTIRPIESQKKRLYILKTIMNKRSIIIIFMVLLVAKFIITQNETMFSESQNLAKLSAYEMRQLIRFGIMPDRIEQFLHNITNNYEF